MYEIAKNVIMRKDYKLSEMLKNIKALWLGGDITEEECTELTDLARSNASAEAGMNAEWMASIEARLEKLETKGSAPSGVEEFVVGRRYKNGEKCLWKGKTYICVAPEGQVCVWSPDDYPAYWQLEA